MIEKDRKLIESIEDISSRYLKKGLSIDERVLPRLTINTDNTGACHPDWSLEYWTNPRTYYEILNYCLSVEDLRKLLKFARFSPLEMFVEEVVNEIKDQFKIKRISSEILQDVEDQEELLLVEIFVDEKDEKRVIELWKKISTTIRNEINRKFGDKGDEYQLKLLISVKPTN